MKNHSFLPALCWLLIAILWSCQRPLFSGDDDPKVSNAMWDSLAVPSERPLLNLHASPFELMAISENQFFRYNADKQLVEQRPLNLVSGHFGSPALSDNTFSRLTTDANANQFIEFRLTRNPMPMIRLAVDSLKGPGDTHLEVEFLARRLGAFSEDGTRFLLPVKTFPAKRYAMLLFEIRHNAAHDLFDTVKLIHRTDIPDLNTDFGNLGNIRFLSGNFYIASQTGAWRITPEGQVLKLFPQWVLDFFQWKEELYATGLNTFDLHRSTDSGLSWLRLDENTALKYVEVASDSVFSQQALGNPFRLALTGWANSKAIRWPNVSAAQSGGAFYGFAFFSNRFFFSIDRKIYFTDHIVTE